MTLRIPLPWWSKRVYDINKDELRGGWRLLIVRIQAKSCPLYCGPNVGVTLTVQAGIGLKP